LLAVLDFDRVLRSTYLLVVVFFVGIPAACLITLIVKFMAEECFGVADSGSELEISSYTRNTVSGRRRGAAYNAWTGVDTV
jgi:hypothetical protein